MRLNSIFVALTASDRDSGNRAEFVTTKHPINEQLKQEKPIISSSSFRNPSYSKKKNYKLPLRATISIIPVLSNSYIIQGDNKYPIIRFLINHSVIPTSLHGDLRNPDQQRKETHPNSAKINTADMYSKLARSSQPCDLSPPSEKKKSKKSKEIQQQPETHQL